MGTEWLATESFERSHEIISAINTLSIHMKLSLAGIPDVDSQLEVAEARCRLNEFLDRFGHVVADIEQEDKGTALGADSRLNLLAKQYIDANRHQGVGVSTSESSIELFRSLLDSKDRAKQADLIDMLRDLRILVEQHAHADVVGVLGEM